MTTSSIRWPFAPIPSWACAGLFNAYRAGNVTLGQRARHRRGRRQGALRLRPKIIKYYLGEDPILDNVETYLMTEEKQRRHVLANLDKQVVKAVGESGGYGMLIGPQSTASSAKSSRGTSKPIRATTSPSRRWIFRARHASSTIGWNRATSICGPTFCSATR